jgi:type 1 fimbriae regulatory protein FimB
VRKNIGEKSQKKTRVPQSIQSAAAESGAARPKKKYRPRTMLEDADYLTQQEIERFFRAIQSKRDRAIFRLVYHRGLRAHEIGILELDDFRARDGVLYVKRGKGSISREYSLVNNELKALRAYLREERGTAPGPLFPSRQGGKGISRYRLDDLMKLYCRRAGIRRDKAHMHALKHSCGTHLSERGSTPQEIQDWLGHRDPKSTAIYTHFTPAQRRQAFEKHRDW